MSTLWTSDLGQHRWVWALPFAVIFLSAPLWLHWWEPQLFLAINYACAHLPMAVWTGVSVLGNGWGVFAITSPLLVRQPRLMWAWLCAAPFAIVFARLGKGWIVSPRPAAEIDNTLMHIAGEKLELVSMPSGHTLTAFAVATSLYFAIDARRRHAFLWLWLLAALVGLSRIAVGAHWAGDVAVGAGLGMLAGLMGHVLLQRLNAAYFDPTGWRLRCVAAALVLTIYTLLTEVLDFEENTVVQRMLAMLAATMLVVFIRQNMGARVR